MTKCFIVAEAGVNHNGSLGMALDLVDAAVAAGADAVKFQSFQADGVIRPGTEKAEYQKKMTGDGDQHSMIRALELSEDDHKRIAAHCSARGIEFMSTPFDYWAVDLLLGLGIRRFKIPSGEVTNKPFIEYIAGSGLPIILSTGMSELREVERAVSWVAAVRNRHGHSGPLAETLTVLHCTSNYPTAYSDVNLRAMLTLRDRLCLPVGYSDHTLGIEASVAAVAMGAQVIEKHFTLDRSLPGPDHTASLDPPGLTRLVEAIRNVEASLGASTKAPTASEIPVRDLVRRSAHLRRSVKAGAELNKADIVFLRPGTGIAPFEVERLLGAKVRDDLPEGTMLEWSDLA